MSIFEQLVEKINELPALERRAAQIGRLKQFDSRLAIAGNSLASAAGAQRQIRDHFSDVDVSRAGVSIRRAAETARKVQARLAASTDVIDDKATEESIAKVADSARSALAAVKDGWQRYIDRTVSGYDGLVAAASAAQLDSGGNLKRAIEDVRNLQTSAPADPDAALLAQTRVNELSHAVRTLGLEGKVGHFVMEATLGGADPRILIEDAEVRRFVEEHNLWQILRVKLR